MKQQAFEAAHEAQWTAFEAALGQLDRGRRRGENAPAPDFPERYRGICHHLAMARERRYTAALVQHLNGLVLRGHHALYGARPGLQRTWARYLAAGFPRLVRSSWRAVALAAALFYLPFLGLPVVIHADPEVAYLVQDPQALSRMEDMYRSGNRRFGRENEAEADLTMFGFYIWNNLRITLQAFASGLALGLGSIFFLLANGIQGGAVAGHLTRMGLGGNFWSFVITHSALETTGIVLAGAGGMKLGFAVLAPGRKSRLRSLKDAARPGVRLVYGAACMVFLAAFVEAFWSASARVAQGWKFAVGAGLWAAVAAYFAFAGRRHA